MLTHKQLVESIIRRNAAKRYPKAHSNYNAHIRAWLWYRVREFRKENELI